MKKICKQLMSLLIISLIMITTTAGVFASAPETITIDKTWGMKTHYGSYIGKDYKGVIGTYQLGTGGYKLEGTGERVYDIKILDTSEGTGPDTLPLVNFEDLNSECVPNERVLKKMLLATYLPTGMEHDEQWDTHIRVIAIKHIGTVAAGKPEYSHYNKMIASFENPEYRDKMSEDGLAVSQKTIALTKKLLSDIESTVDSEEKSSLEIENQDAQDFVYNKKTGYYESDEYKVVKTGYLDEAYTVTADDAKAEIVQGSEKDTFKIRIKKADYTEQKDITAKVTAKFNTYSSYIYSTLGKYQSHILYPKKDTSTLTQSVSVRGEVTAQENNEEENNNTTSPNEEENNNETTESESENTANTKTGDSSNILVIAAAMLISAGAGFALLRKFKKTN